MADCLEFQKSTFTTTGRQIDRFYNDGISIENCTDFVLLTANEYIVLETQSTNFLNMGDIVTDANFDIFVQIFVVALFVLSFYSGFNSGYTK